MLQHKLITGICLLLIVGGGYFGYQRLAGNKNAVRYVTAAAEKGTLVVSVSGSGQVNTLDQIDIKSKIAGDIIKLTAEDNQKVKAGTLLVQLDSRDAQKAVLDAQTNLTDAQLTLKNLPGKAKESLDKTYDDSLDVLTSAFEDFPGIIENLKPIFTECSYEGDKSDIDYYLRVVRFYNFGSEILSFWEGGRETRYFQIEKEFKELEKDYLGLNLDSPKEKIETGLGKTLEFTQSFLDLARQSANLVGKYQNTLKSENLIPPFSTTITSNQYSQLTNFVSTLSTHKSSLSSMKDKLTDAKEAFEKEDVDIPSQELLVKQREFDLEDAKERLAEHFIKSPFDGIITKVNVKEGDSISANTIVATIITKQKIAEISLNEVDAAKAKVGQKTTITFDALPEVSISGKIIEIDTVGTVTQGVVSYGVKIAFDTEEEKVKPGMSVTVDIITNVKQNVVLVPNSAVKTQNDAHYVEVMTDNNIPRVQSVEIGISNDTITEIVSGLQEGDIIVTSTVSSNNVQTTQTRTNQSRGTQEFQIPGL